jgi:ATP synthase protein I
MFRAILFQIWAVVITAGLLGTFVGGHGAASAAVGGGACLLPNALFALRLAVAARRPGGPGVAGFFLGEFVKVAATIGILAVAAKVYPEMHWPSMLLGLVVTLQASFLAFWKKS